jgi:hypothetical protein
MDDLALNKRIAFDFHRVRLQEAEAFRDTIIVRHHRERMEKLQAGGGASRRPGPCGSYNLGGALRARGIELDIKVAHRVPPQFNQIVR